MVQIPTLAALQWRVVCSIRLLQFAFEKCVMTKWLACWPPPIVSLGSGGHGFETTNEANHSQLAFTHLTEHLNMFVGLGIFITIDQSHRYGRHPAACREPSRSYNKTTRTAICFEHKTQYLLIRAPFTRIVVFWHTSNIPHHDFARSN